MEIRVNGHTLDFTLDDEKTVGQVLAGLEVWLSDAGNRISEISIDGQPVTISMIEEQFSREIETIKQLDISTGIVADLAAESLVTLLDDIKEYESLDFNERTKFFDNWNESACAKFIFSQRNDLYLLCVDTFFRGEIDSKRLYSITEERLREVQNPLNELINIETDLDDVCERLIALPLDIQTGKDAQAAQTIHLFTDIAGKILRIFYQLDTQKILDKEHNKEGRKIIIDQITEFNGVLKELQDAYERNDSVLIGDLAEYEASVRIKEIYSVIVENSRGKP